MPEPNQWTPGEIRALRKRLGYTQVQMADAMGYSHAASISALERGASRPSGPVRKLLDHLDARGDLPDMR